MQSFLRALAPYLVVALLAFVAGGLSCRPGPEDPAVTALRDSLDLSRAETGRLAAARDSAVDVLRAEAAREAERARAQQRAGAEASRRAAVAGARGDSLLRELAGARTAGDSVPLLVETIDAMRDRVAGVEIARDRYAEAAEDALSALARLVAALDTARAEVSSQRARVAAYERLVEGMRPQRECRVLGLMPCPVLGAGYAATVRGGTVELRPALSVVVPLWGPGGA